MKKLLLVLFASVLIFSVANSQAIKTGDQAVNVGLGLGGSMIEGVGLPALILSYETLPFEKLGIGYLSVGGYFAFKHSNYDYGYWGTNYDLKYNYWVFGGRAAYHFDFYEMNGDDFFNQFDVYAGVFLGFGINTVKYDSSWGIDFDNDFFIREDMFVGCRYKFSDNLSVFSELSYGISWLSGGVSFLF